MRPLSLLALVVLISGCGLPHAWAPEQQLSDVRGDVSKLRYILEPGDGASGVPLVPTIRWDTSRVKEELGKPTRVVLLITTADGHPVYRVESKGPEQDGSWLLRGGALRVFSRPDGTTVTIDPAHQASSKLAPNTSYHLSLRAENDVRRTQLLETVRFGTESAPAPSR